MKYLAIAFRLASAALVLVPLSRADTQERVPSQVLLKRLAEAVDGHRHGRNVYVVASYDSLNPVTGVFGTRREAEESARGRGESLAVFGPYRYEPIPPAPPLPDVLVRELRIPERRVIGCEHDGSSSAWRAICPELMMPLDSIQAISLTFRMRNGTIRTRNVPLSTDAVFLSLPAIDKFVLPYYAGIVGLDGAAAMRYYIMTKAATLRTP